MMGFLLLHRRPPQLAMIGLGGGSLVKAATTGTVRRPKALDRSAADSLLAAFTLVTRP